jgi:hypothetical protein
MLRAFKAQYQHDFEVFLRPYRIVPEETYSKIVKIAKTLETKLMIMFMSLKNTCDPDAKSSV